MVQKYTQATASACYSQSPSSSSASSSPAADPLPNTASSASKSLFKSTSSSSQGARFPAKPLNLITSRLSLLISSSRRSTRPFSWRIKSLPHLSSCNLLTPLFGPSPPALGGPRGGKAPGRIGSSGKFSSDGRGMGGSKWRRSSKVVLSESRRFCSAALGLSDSPPSSAAPYWISTPAAT
jgi:hypothetical protein